MRLTVDPHQVLPPVGRDFRAFEASHMRYLIHTPKGAGDKLSGPFDPIETLRRARWLRETGVEFLITDENGITAVSDDHIKKYT
jgi:hypothetical protein